MKKNMGSLDKGIRVVAAVIIAILFYLDVISGTTAYILMGVSIILLLTSFVNFCPLYAPFGISTCKTKS